MKIDDLEISLLPSLAAQGHLLAFALAHSLRDRADAEETLDEVASAFIHDWTEQLPAEVAHDELRARLTEEYSEEMHRIVRLAVGMVDRMRST